MPHTLETSDALNEVDELDDLIDEQDDGSVVEEAGDESEEIGHVEDVEPGQEWNNEGAYVGAAEIIEVPFRKTVKSKATVQAAFDVEQNCWRAGCYWKSLLKKSGCNEFGQSLSRANPGFETMAAAVNSVLTRMAEESEAFDKKIAEDILKFRDTDWFVKPAEAATDPDAEADLQDAVHEIETAGGSVGQAPTEEEQRAKAESIFRKKMRDGADYLASCTLARIDAESVFKTAKAEEKAAAESLRAIADRGPERLPLFEAAEREKAKAESNGQVARAVKSAASDSWKSACVTELGLPKGVTQKLIDDGCDTIGRLEQRRADIAMKKEKWPRGIGKGAIDKIENAVLDWLKHNQPVDEGSTVDVGGNTTSDDAATDESTSEIGDVEARAGLLIKTGVVPNKESGAYQSGQEAFDKGWPLADCPYVPGDDQDQWLMGWHDAKEEASDLE